jgi:large subunit ribosomal protein L18
MESTRLKLHRRVRRKRHVRKKVFGSPERPRLTVFRSLQHIYCQIIDDASGHTIAASSTLRLRQKGVQFPSGGNKAAAELVGRDIAEQAKAKGVTRIVFDRDGFRYHGRVKALAEAARKSGLVF